MQLVELQNKIHQQNVEMGWWDEQRPFHTFVCLFHSELSEAMEGDRKNLMDDHLPQYPMFQVELADFVIRCLDWLGSVKNDETSSARLPFQQEYTATSLLALMHWYVSDAYEADEVNDDYGRDINLLDAVTICFEFAKVKDFDLHKIIEEKVAYNKTRADHKRENRAKEGGKKY